LRQPCFSGREQRSSSAALLPGTRSPACTIDLQATFEHSAGSVWERSF
jgi:hypothetical protein